MQESANNANAYANILMPVNAQMGNISYALCAVIGTAAAYFIMRAIDPKLSKGRWEQKIISVTHPEETENAEAFIAQGEPVGVAAIAGNDVGSGSALVGNAVAGVPQVSSEASAEMEEATNNYVEELKRLTELLSAVADQSQRLTRDSEEMENLNRTLTGISRVYEMQLKSASAQMGTIDEINEQSRIMASQISELNKIYARMIEGMRN